MAKPLKKRKLAAKGGLLLVLILILGGLSVGYAVTEKRAQQAENPPVQSAEPAPTAAPEPVTVPEETTATEPAQEPTTAAVVPPPVAGNPILVSPTGDKWALTVVNLQYCLPEGYVPELAAAVEGSAVQLDARVAPYYAQMYAAAKKDGCTLTPYSGYRSYERQENNFNRKVEYYVQQGLSEADAKLKTQERILPPGSSEHNMGFAMDVVSASADFVSTKEFSWLCTHAWEYGFILRYPAEKTGVTGVMYEPWHWRYVGKTAAKAMQESGQCLEEYVAQTQA